GDEFAILLPSAVSETEVIAVADRILDSLRVPLPVADRLIEVTASIGIALNPDGQYGRDELLRNADMAMYLAKERGKGRYEVFTVGLEAAGFERLEMKAALRRAIDEEELMLYFQPILDVSTRTVCGAEALVRWRHPERGILGPGALVPLAEETGLILPLGAWVLGDALRQLAVWRGRGLVEENFRISVNVSVRQMRESDLIAVVADSLEAHAVPPSCLTLEITESLLVDSELERNGLLERLRSLGVSIAVDDFGTGYSGLNYLQRFAVDVLKIDRSFVDGLELPSADLSVVRTVIDLARRVGAVTVAEGIECYEQFEVLRDLGCEFAQGFYFSKPIPPAEFAALIAGSSGDLSVAEMEDPFEQAPTGTSAGAGI
ncbi:MAG: bifunctional diguanylate cyclase/phosphodiesterase, partial [Acidimicrobiales bacterium]|nr:bifunctional diguanylate cyclase/phosphodiesterase [Acidimicrobiales bacterium]